MANLSAFPPIGSSINIQSPQGKANIESWQPILDKFATALNISAGEGNPNSISTHQGRGQVLARDRVALLLDADSPFLELCPLAGLELSGSSPSASLVAGIGSICGRICLILSHIPTLSGGAWNEYTVLKQNRVTAIATENRLPVVALVQSAGVFLPQQFRVFHPGGQIFRDLAVRTAEGLQSCAIVFGSCTAGGAYHPALSDYTIFVDGQAQVFLGGPPLVKMATGEIIGAEELGGARIHANLTGLADQLAVDEFDAIRKARTWISSLPSQRIRDRVYDLIAPPRYSADEITAIVDPDIRKPLDMKEVLLRIVDDSRLSIFKPNFGPNLLTAWAEVMGMTIGILANQVPVINADEALKGAQFIRMCNQQNTPIVFFHNVTGFMVGSKAEHASIIKKGAQMVSAVSCSKVPHISIIMGASYGAGNYAMCGRAYRPRFLFSWPTSRCGVMGPDQLAGVMSTIKSKKSGSNAADAARRTQKLRDEVEHDSQSYRTSAVLLDDGVIDPRDTREVLGMCLEVVQLEDVRGAESHRVLARM